MALCCTEVVQKAAAFSDLLPRVCSTPADQHGTGGRKVVPGFLHKSLAVSPNVADRWHEQGELLTGLVTDACAGLLPYKIEPATEESAGLYRS